MVLLGDAARTHRPAGGQGMNTGIQDAADLAWRLAEAVRPGGDVGLVQSFETERRPVAEELISFTGQLTALTTLLADPGATETSVTKSDSDGSVEVIPAPRLSGPALVRPDGVVHQTGVIGG